MSHLFPSGGHRISALSLSLCGFFNLNFKHLLPHSNLNTTHRCSFWVLSDQNICLLKNFQWIPTTFIQQIFNRQSTGLWRNSCTKGIGLRLYPQRIYTDKKISPVNTKLILLANYFFFLVFAWIFETINIGSISLKWSFNKALAIKIIRRIRSVLGIQNWFKSFAFHYKGKKGSTTLRFLFRLTWGTVIMQI